MSGIDESMPSPEAAQVSFKKARFLYHRCEYEHALAMVDYAISQDRGQRDFYKLKVSVLNDMPGDTTNSVRALMEALERWVALDPKDPEPLIQLAETCEALHLSARAGRYWQMAAAIAPNHPKVKPHLPEDTLPGILLKGVGQIQEKATGLLGRFLRR